VAAVSAAQVSRHAQGNSGPGFPAPPSVVRIEDADPVARIAAFAAYLRQFATLAELLDTARVLGVHLEAFAAGCWRLLLVPPPSAATAAGDLGRWAAEEGCVTGVRRPEGSGEPRRTGRGPGNPRRGPGEPGTGSPVNDGVPR
jgi:hypothetical protein